MIAGRLQPTANNHYNFLQKNMCAEGLMLISNKLTANICVSLGIITTTWIPTIQLHVYLYLFILSLI